MINQNVIDVGEPAEIQQHGSGFDYTTLDLTDSAMNSVIAERDKIRILYRSTQENYIEIGHALINVKSTLPHGQFGHWIDAEFGWSSATARKLIQVAEQFPEIAHPERFEMTALYALAADKVPEQIRNQFIEQADAGQPVRLKDVREAIGTSRESKSKTDPTVIELVAEIVRLMVMGYDGQGVRTKIGWGSAVKSNLFEQEIAQYEEDEQHEIAKIIAAFGDACLKAATPYLEGR